MLVVQPTSTCDVCLERYAWDAPASEHLSRPHVITCGHVFCHQCLQNLRVPRTCPLCRASFHLTRAVRVHVDLATDASPELLLSPEEAEARRFELRLAGLARPRAANTDGDISQDQDQDQDEGEGEGEDEEEEVVVQEARAWLEDHVLGGASSDSHPILHALLSSVTSLQSLNTRIRTTQAETARVRGERDNARRHARRAERAREQEAALARTSEKTWTVRVQEIERECEMKLTEAAAERRRLEDELANLRAALKDAHAAQSDALVQAHLQIRDQNLANTTAAAAAVAAPPYSSPGRSTDQQQQHQEAGPSSTTSNAPSSSGIAFPRSSSPAYDSYGFSYSHNPLPRPPEPVPLSRLPAFARPRPGSSAYTAARALARHAHRLGSDKEVERRERKREREKGRERRTEDEREVDRERRRRERKERVKEKEKEGTGTESGTARERRQKSSRAAGRGRDRETDTSATSATETQDRQRARSRPRHDEGPEDANANVPPASMASLPRDVVGGWGLERSWRASASLVSSTSGASAPVSREDLRGDFREAAGAVGSSHTKMRVREEKGKGKEKEREREREREKDAEEDREDYVFVRSTREGRDHDELPRGRERERHVSFSAYPSESREPMQPQAQAQSQGRERRTTLSAAPSALGLVLVPSPDGHGAYEYQYQYPFQYRPIAAQSTIQAGSAGAGASGKESTTALASMNGIRNHAQNVGYSFDGVHDVHGRASTASNATLTRRATDSQTQPQGYAVPRHPSTALHVPQPRRISLTIPEPDSDLSPRSEPTQPQSQPQTQPFRNETAYVGGHGAFPSAYEQRNAVGAGGIYSNTNPSASMSLDSALASLSLAAGDNTGQSSVVNRGAAMGQRQQTLRHRTSDSSATSASTGISLRGTSREKRKQLLDALFTDTEPGAGTGSGSVSTRSSYASKSDPNANANRVSLGREIDAGTGTGVAAAKGEATAGAARATAQQDTTTSGPPPLVDSVRAAVAPRGVPSRDGRPSRGLSSSTRPSTIQPIQSTVEATAAQARPNGTAYPTQASSHARQATYPPSTYPSAYGAQPTYTSNMAVYQPQSNSSAAAYSTSYPAYFHHAQGQAQTHSTSVVPSAARYGNYGVVHAGAAGTGAQAQAQARP